MNTIMDSAVVNGAWQRTMLTFLLIIVLIWWSGCILLCRILLHAHKLIYARRHRHRFQSASCSIQSHITAGTCCALCMCAPVCVCAEVHSKRQSKRQQELLCALLHPQHSLQISVTIESYGTLRKIQFCSNTPWRSALAQISKPPLCEFSKKNPKNFIDSNWNIMPLSSSEGNKRIFTERNTSSCLLKANVSNH